LPAGDPDAELTDLGPHAGGHRRDVVVQSGDPQRGGQLGRRRVAVTVGRVGRVGQQDVVGDGAGEHRMALRQVAETGALGRRPPVRVLSVDEHPPRVGREQAGEHAGERGLSRPHRAGDPDQAPGRHGQADRAQRREAGAWIGEAHLVQDHGRRLRGPCGRG
jgi:hypothetical protein